MKNTTKPLATTTVGVARLLELAAERGHLTDETLADLVTALEALQMDLETSIAQGIDTRLSGFARINASLLERI